MSDLKVTLIQCDLQWQNPALNRKRLQAAVEKELKLSGPVDLAVLPEMFSTGFCMDTAGQAEEMAGPTVKWLRELAASTGAVITGSLIIAENGHFYNRLIWMPPTGELSFYDKRHLFRMAQEEQHYSGGDRQLTVELNGWRVRPLICYDLRFPVWSRNRDDYDLLLLVANWPAKRRDVWRILLQARAAENLAWLVAVNRVGQDDNGIDYSGDSSVIDPQGIPLLTLPDEEATSTVILSRNQLDQWRQRFPAHLDGDDFRLE